MLSAAKVPDYYNTGTFHLIELGFFVRLSNKFSALAFSGLRLHGGNAPSCPQGCDWVNWGTRVVFILYPAAHILNNSSLTALGSVDVRLRNGEQELRVVVDEMKRRKEQEEAGRDADEVDSDPDDTPEFPDLPIDELEEKHFQVKYPNMVKLPTSIKSKSV